LQSSLRILRPGPSGLERAEQLPLFTARAGRPFLAVQRLPGLPASRTSRRTDGWRIEPDRPRLPARAVDPLPGIAAPADGGSELEVSVLMWRFKIAFMREPWLHTDDFSA